MTKCLKKDLCVDFHAMRKMLFYEISETEIRELERKFCLRQTDDLFNCFSSEEEANKSEKSENVLAFSMYAYAITEKGQHAIKKWYGEKCIVCNVGIPNSNNEWNKDKELLDEISFIEIARDFTNLIDIDLLNFYDLFGVIFYIFSCYAANRRITYEIFYLFILFLSAYCECNCMRFVQSFKKEIYELSKTDEQFCLERFLIVAKVLGIDASDIEFHLEDLGINCKSLTMDEMVQVLNGVWSWQTATIISEIAEYKKSETSSCVIL